MRRSHRRGVRHWTRHSLVLTGAGLIYIGLGISFFNAPAIAAKDPSLKVALQWLSFNEWGVVYICVGVLAMIAAVARVGHKSWGYILLTALSSAWAAFYLMGLFYSKRPVMTLLSSLIWLLLAFIWWAVSGLLSPEHVKMMTDEHLPR